MLVVAHDVVMICCCCIHASKSVKQIYVCLDAEMFGCVLDYVHLKAILSDAVISN